MPTRALAGFLASTPLPPSAPKAGTRAGPSLFTGEMIHSGKGTVVRARQIPTRLAILTPKRLGPDLGLTPLRRRIVGRSLRDP